MSNNIACRVFKEQLELIDQLPDGERQNVLYLALKHAFNQFEYQNENQIEIQNENAYVSVSDSVSKLGNTIFNVLSKSIIAKEFSTNYGGRRTNAGRPKANQTEIKKNNQFEYQNENQIEKPNIAPNKKININTLFVIGSPMWNFPVELVPLAKKYWKDETIREIEKSNSDTIERQTSIEQLLIRYPTDKKTPKPETQEFVLPDIRFANAWNDWMQYKTQKKEKYLFSSLPKLWNQLIKLSNGDPAQAQAVVDQSIANNYKGLFPLKNDKSTELKRKNAENAAALMEWMND